MDHPSSAMRELAQHLLAVEAAKQDSPDEQVHAAVRVCEKLRISLTRLAGAEGFTSLMRRAVALARAEVPALKGISVKPDGSLVGLEALGAGNESESTAAALAITAHLLALLVTFIGRSLTLRLLHEAWPNAALDASLDE
jgi:hypothetical protein